MSQEKRIYVGMHSVPTAGKPGNEGQLHRWNTETKPTRNEEHPKDATITRKENLRWDARRGLLRCQFRRRENLETRANYTAGTAAARLTSSPANPQRAYLAAYEAGVYRTDDGGSTWQRLGSYPTDYAHSVLAHPNEPDTVFVGSEPAAIFRSSDGGPVNVRDLRMTISGRLEVASVPGDRTAMPGFHASDPCDSPRSRTCAWLRTTPIVCTPALKSVGWCLPMTEEIAGSNCRVSTRISTV